MEKHLYNNIGSLDLLSCELATLQWSKNLGILTNGKAETQYLKLVSEIGELADSLAKNKDIKDDVGDCLVLLTNFCYLKGTTLMECWNHALDDIKDRKGYLCKNGNFVKDTDPNYREIIKNDN